MTGAIIYGQMMGMKHTAGKRSIGIIIATTIEAEPFLRGLDLATAETKPVRVWSGERVVLALSDIGKSNAAIATAHCIEAHRPSVILNFGAAGAADPKAAIGDIYHVDKVYELDRPQMQHATPVVHKPDTLKGFRRASCGTADRPVLEAHERARAAQFADIVDMEASAIVQACGRYGVKCHIFKVITDTEGSGVRDIIRNMVLTRNSLFEFYRDRVAPLV